MYVVIEKPKKKKLEKICGLFTAINSFGKLMMEVVFQMGEIFLNGRYVLNVE